jgi:excisionase family DNA binding protein
MTTTLAADAYLSLEQLTAYSGLSRRMLEKYLVDPVHPLPHYRFGRRIEIKRSEFDAWARAHHRVAREPIDVRALVDAKLKTG